MMNKTGKYKNRDPGWTEERILSFKFYLTAIAITNNITLVIFQKTTYYLLQIDRVFFSKKNILLHWINSKKEIKAKCSTLILLSTTSIT